MKASAEILEESGRVGLTVGAVARRAGVTTGAVYANFVDREDLVAEGYRHLTEERFAAERNVTSMARLVFRSGPPDVDELYVTAGRMCSANGERSRNVFQDAMLAGIHSERARSLVIPGLLNEIDKIAAYVRDAQSAEWVRTDIDARSIALAWVATSLGSASLAGVLREPSDPEVDEPGRRALTQMLLAFSINRAPVDSPDNVVPRRPAPHGNYPPESPTYSPAGQGVLEATIESLSEVGNVEIGVTDIAKRAGVTTGSIYSSFKNRSDLLGAAYAERLFRALRQPPTFVDILKDLYWPSDPSRSWDLNTWLSLGGIDGRTRRLYALESYVEATFSPETHRRVAPAARGATARLAEVFSEAQQAGHVMPHLDPVAMATTFSGAFMGMAAFGFLLRPFDDDESARQWVNACLVILRGFEPNVFSALVGPDEFNSGHLNH